MQKIYFSFTPRSKILVACLVALAAVDRFFGRMWAADETSQETLPNVLVSLFLDMNTALLKLRILVAIQDLKLNFYVQMFSLF